MQGIWCSDVEGLALLLGYERDFAFKQELGFIEYALGRLEQGFTMGCRHHAATTTHQQLVTSQLAEFA
ncbi:hypothetical protein UNDYM_5640 [Undibacterium sp. YM2]|nr:hypothetical protein UNDYM_5640 [Undibacterium sp. YM2]